MNTKPGIKNELWPIQVAFEALLQDPNQSQRTRNYIRKIDGALRARDVPLALRVAEAFDPITAVSGRDCEVARQAACLVQKVPFTGDDDARTAAATEKFFRAEARCKSINKLFRRRRQIERKLYPDYPEYTSPVWPSWLARARAEIRRCIGEDPPVDAVLDNARFGPGVAVGIGGDELDFVSKMRVPELPCTPSAVPYVRNAMMRHAQIRSLHYHKRSYKTERGYVDYVCYDDTYANDQFDRRVALVDYNKIQFVPKNAKTFRTIGIEPLGNSFVQLGVDFVLKRCLQSWGIDLADQTRNQRAAFLGSLSDSLKAFATIDLSAASDSLAREVVRALLPAGWYNFLNTLRSPTYNLGGANYVYEKFCSMGNGFCFPLETLVFASVIRASGVPKRDYAVYGDDIIVPQGDALIVIERLNEIGFKTNVDKTFVHGPFRESCGKEYYNGQDVTPFKLDETPLNHEVLCKLHNSLTSRGFDVRKLYDRSTKVYGRYHVRPLETAEQDSLLSAYWLPLADMLGVPGVSVKQRKTKAGTTAFVTWTESRKIPIRRVETRHTMEAVLAGAEAEMLYRSDKSHPLGRTQIAVHNSCGIPLRRATRNTVEEYSFEFATPPSSSPAPLEANEIKLPPWVNVWVPSQVVHETIVWDPMTFCRRQTVRHFGGNALLS